MKSRFHLRNFCITVGCLVFYITTSDVLGFLISSTMVLSTMFLALRVRLSWVLPMSLIVTLVVHTIFYKALRVPLPWGVLMPFQWRIPQPPHRRHDLRCAAPSLLAGF